MQRVFVVDKNKQALMPCYPARARQMLRSGKAKVYRRQPFTIILTERAGGETQPVEAKVDPGSKTTGIALVGHFKRGLRLLWAAEVTHRGQAVHNALQSRAASRRSRRSRHTRYRPARFLNRRRDKGWLSPSLLSRVDNTTTWLKRLSRWCPISDVTLELVKFDTQLMQSPEISGVEYQQGTLFGYEIYQYLLEKWDRKCAYCGKTGVPFEREHIIPRSRGGSDRISNLTLTCHQCNDKKGNQTAAEFGHPEVQAQVKQPLRDVATINATRHLLYRRLENLGLHVQTGTGGQTQFNRIQQSYPKAHWLDAACVGQTGQQVYVASNHAPLLICAAGRQNRQMTLVNKHGFPRSRAKAARFSHGFQSGDLVKAHVKAGKRTGYYRGKVAIKASGSFTVDGVSDIWWKYCTLLQCADGYDYKKGETAHAS